MCCRIRILFWVIMYFSTMMTADSDNRSDFVSPPDYDFFVLACGGTTEAADTNGRKWTSDAKFLTSPNDSVSLTAQIQDPSLPSIVPYMTARIFESEATYKFPVSERSRHWIRLHFYPSAYGKYDPSASFFSVSSCGFTLLNNFSVSITAEAREQDYLVREFTMIPQESGTLNLTFAPSNGSFAFINGIEIIPMPEIFQSATRVGSPNEDVDVRSNTMQTMFRLNVGGQYIAANLDSGLNRTWYDDSAYIFGAAFGVTSEADRSVVIAYPSMDSRYIAPADVYRTARTMGPNATINSNYNLTWIFQIDANFTYLVRLHFCEYQFDKANQRVFGVFLNNKTAESEADVIAWSGGKGIPFYKDYAMYVSGRNGDEQLWLAMHPNVQMKPQYYDSILNGLEIFKLSDQKRNLAGLNPVPLPENDADQSNQGSIDSPSRTSHTGRIIGSVIGSLAGLGLFVGIIVFVKHRKRRINREFSSTSWLPIYGSSRSSGTKTMSKSSGSSKMSSLSGICRHFSLAEIRLGTDNFSESRVIGVGGFGKVYKGFIDGRSTTTVAIKRANPSSDQGIHEFLNEIELLSKLRHQHLVSLIGACEENNEMILVYDYMANGTLREHLYNGRNPPLPWIQRLEICIGASKGIHYLHTGAKFTIIHRDVKSTNILLDDKWVAKVSDFGLSKTGQALDQTHVSTVVKGSFGYLDPEYFRRQQLTEKSDVYSFGVVLFEVLCGRSALNPTLPKEQVSLADWALLNQRRGTLESIIDPQIRGEITAECLKHFTETAVKCLSDHGPDRPSMGQVLWNLEYSLQLQNNPDGSTAAAHQKADHACATNATLTSIQEVDEKCDEVQNHSAESSMFSQMVSPEGR